MSRKLYLHNCIYTLDKYLSTNKDRDYHLRNVRQSTYMKHILITGGSGFIGHRLLGLLATMNHSLRATYLNNKPVKDLSLSKHMTTLSKLSTYSRLSLMSLTAEAAPRLIDTTAHLLPSNS